MSYEWCMRVGLEFMNYSDKLISTFNKRNLAVKIHVATFYRSIPQIFFSFAGALLLVLNALLTIELMQPRSVSGRR